jgi:hypothetical protein
MNASESWTSRWFPKSRFDVDFPLVLWFVGLWLYLKSFLYLCYVYMFGLEPLPLPTASMVEVVYFVITIVPCLLLGRAMWNDKRNFVVPSIVFMAIDTPFLIFHILRLADAGYLDSGLTTVLELGSLTLNIISLAWLLGSFSTLRRPASQKPTPSQ